MVASRRQFVGQLQKPGAKPENVEMVVEERPDITELEKAAGIKWVSGRYEPGDVRRYGAILDGTTDDSTALANAIAANDIAFVPEGTLNVGSTTTTINTRQGIRGIGNQSIIRYTGSGNVFDVTGDEANFDNFRINMTAASAVGIDLNDQSYANIFRVLIFGDYDTVAGQKGIVIDGDSSGGYWNRVVSCYIRAVATGVEMLNDANSNDFIGCVIREVDVGYRIDGVTGSGFHAVNNHIVGGSIDTFDSYGIDLEDCDYTNVHGVYLESVVVGSRPWRIQETAAGNASNNVFFGEFNNVTLGPTDNGTNTMRIGGASDARVAAPKIIGDSLRFSSNDESITVGTGSPESSVTEVKGSIYIQTDANPNTGGNLLWQKTTTGGNTGWRPLEIERPRGQVTLSSGTANVTFGTNEPDASYFILFGSDTTGETFRWSAKATTGFTVTSSNASSTAVVDYLVVR